MHNDVKPSNIGYLIDEEGYPRGQFIDFGSISYCQRESDGATKSIFPSTSIYLSANKVPKVVLSDIDFGNSDIMNEEEYDDFVKSVKTTSKMALPNYEGGVGDNICAMSMTFLECIFGIHPVLALIDSNDVGSIYHCIENTDFYDYLVTSDIYKEHYQDDEEFAIVEAFIKLGFSRDLEKREKFAID